MIVVQTDRGPDRAKPSERPGFRFMSLLSGRADACALRGCGQIAAGRFAMPILGEDRTVDLCRDCIEAIRDRWNLFGGLGDMGIEVTMGDLKLLGEAGDAPDEWFFDGPNSPWKGPERRRRS